MIITVLLRTLDRSCPQKSSQHDEPVASQQAIMGSLDALHHTESRQYDPMLTVLEMTPPASPVDLIYLHAQYEQAAALHELEGGDISGILAQAMKKAVSISAPTFFATNTDLFQDSIAAIQFGFAGVVVVPCAVPIVPIGVGIFPQVWLVNLAAWL